LKSFGTSYIIQVGGRLPKPGSISSEATKHKRKLRIGTVRKAFMVIVSRWEMRMIMAIPWMAPVGEGFPQDMINLGRIIMPQQGN
jgi:hypothetical protein